VALTGIEGGFGWGSGAFVLSLSMPWHFLYFFPLPQGQGSFLPILLDDLNMN